MSTDSRAPSPASSASFPASPGPSPAFSGSFPARGRVAAPRIVLAALAALAVGGPGRVEPALAGVEPVPAGVGSALALPASPPALVRFRWPLDGRPRVVRRFEPPPRPWLPGHRGVDLAADPGVAVTAAGPAAAVYAAGPGIVRFAGQLAGRGVVSIEHADGLRTTYEPVTALAAAGQEVRAGDMIGRLDAGHRGCPAAACLHWGLRRGGSYLDPLALVGAARVRLLPLAPEAP